MTLVDIFRIGVEKMSNRNDNISLYDHEILALAQISYIDWTRIGVNVHGLTVRQALGRAQNNISRFPPNNGGFTPQDYRQFISRVLSNPNGRYSRLLGLRYTGYLNYRPSARTPSSDTLVMAALTDENNNTIILSTGTEGSFDGHVTGGFSFLTPGWLSNFSLGAGRGDVAIRRRVARFVQTHTGNENEVLFLGHSRGFSLSLIGALYSRNGNVNVLGIQGFSGFFSLTPEERARLEALGVINWAVHGDPVSHIGPGVGRTIVFDRAGHAYFWDGTRFRRMTPEEKSNFAHYLLAFRTDENGNLVRGQSDFMQLFYQNLTSRLIVRNPSLIDALFGILDNYLNPVAQAEQERIAELKYVVAGAKTKCSYGLRESKLLTPESKGIYIHDLPQLTQKHKGSENVICFGGCASLYNPTTLEVSEELESTSPGLFLRKGFVLRNIFLNPRSRAGSTTLYGECEFQGRLSWWVAKDNVFLNEEKALLRSCMLPCMYGGVITIEDDGQLK